VVRVNRAECDLLGMSPSDMIGKPVWDFAVPEEREDSRASVGRKFAEGRVQPPHNRRYIAATGRAHLPDSRAIDHPARRRSDGYPHRHVGPDRAQESERKIKFRPACWNRWAMPSSPWIATTESPTAMKPPSACSAWRPGALGTDYRSLVSVEPAASERQAVFAPVSERRFWKGEIAVTNRNGKRTVLDVSDSALRDQNGDLQGIIAILRDVTERKLAEDKIVWLAPFPSRTPIPLWKSKCERVGPLCQSGSPRLVPDLQRQGWTHPWLAGLEQLAEGLTRADEHEARRDVIVDDRYWARTISTFRRRGGCESMASTSRNVNGRRRPSARVKASS